MNVERDWKNATPPAGEPGKARGLLFQDSDGPARLTLLPPVPALAEVVEHHWIVEWDLAAPLARENVPHPNIHLVVQRGRTGVIGIPRGVFRTTLEGKGRVFGVKFRAGAFRPYWSGSLAPLQGKLVGLEEGFGPAGAAYERAIEATTDHEELARTAEAFLLERGRPDPLALEVGGWVARIAREPEIRRVEDLVRLTGRNIRALQRLFGNYVGASPKWVIGRYRMLEAIEQVRAGADLDGAALAAELGYFDQAHFIKDFRQLTGKTPAALARALAR